MRIFRLTCNGQQKDCGHPGATGGFMFEGLLQPMHLIVIVFIALLVFGPSKISQLGKGLGEGIKNFKDAVNEDPSKTAVIKKDSAPVA
jgi:sec-independent protein translocase protein TatA